MSGLAGGGSLPEACGGKRGELVAAYRLLNQEAVSPASLQDGHRRACAERISREAVVLCVQDSSELDFSRRQASGLGEIGDGGGQGLAQHSALAVSVHGEVFGVLRQDCHAKVKPPDGERRRARWRVWRIWTLAAAG
jgi:hypothetical protein